MSKRLGKGLDALIPSLSINDDDKVIEITLSHLRANPYQPRKDFNEESIHELAESIKEHGVIQPIIVRTVIKGYEIIAGERRWRASILAGKATIPAVVRTFTDQQVMEIALIENLQREDLNTMEIATAYQGLIDQFSLTQEQLSAKVGKSRSHIANFLRLLQLPAEIREYVSRGTISMGHARAIAGIANEKDQKKMAKMVVEQGLSVRELEEAVQKQGEPAKIIKNQQKQLRRKDPYIHLAEEELREAYQTTVKIKAAKEKGRIEFSYYSQDDLQRLLDLLQVNKR